MDRSLRNWFLSLLLLPAVAWGFTGASRAIMEGVAATNNAILVSTDTAKVTVGSGGLCYQTGQCSTAPNVASATALGVNKDGVAVSTPTAQINFNGLGFNAALRGAATAYISLNPATTDFIHNQTTAQSATFNVSSGTATSFNSANAIITRSSETYVTITTGTVTDVFRMTEAIIVSSASVPSYTVAVLQTMTPKAAGYIAYCSNCVTDAVCASTGATVGAWVRSSARGTRCQ